MNPQVRTMTPQALADCSACVQLIAHAQRVSGARCLHTDFEVSAATYAAEKAHEVCYSVRFAEGRARAPQAVIGAEYAIDQQRAWLRGPFVSRDAMERGDFDVSATAAFDTLRSELGDRVNLWDGYIETTHEAAINWYRSQGFAEKARHSVYAVQRGNVHVEAQTAVARPSNDATIDAIVALAYESFPGGYLTRAEFAAPASDEAITLAVVGEAGLLGYAYASYEAGAIEAFVDNLAVASHARRRGVGRKLLRAALHWAFEVRDAPQVALVVREGNTNATALYQSVGFSLVADGVHLQLRR